MNRVPTLLAALVALAVPTSAAAAAPASLPTVVRTLTAPQAVKQSCLGVPAATAPGVAVTRYTAPMSGYVTARLHGSAASDWDLVAIDRASGARMGASQGFGSNEVVQQWTSPAQDIALVACRRTGAARTVKLTIDFYDVVRPKTSPKVSVVRVFAGSEKLAALDAAGLDVTESRGAGWADVLVAGADQLGIIEKAGLRHTVRVADLDAFAARSARSSARAGGPSVPSGRTTYRTYEDVQADLKKLVEQHPDTVRPVVIGKTFQGRDIQGVEIAKDVKADDGRPTYFLMGTHHAREWPSEEIAMEYATMLAKGGDARVDRLLAAERTTIVPVVNADGFVSTRTDGQVDPYDNVIYGNDGGANEQLPIDGQTAESVAPPGGILAYRRKNCDGAVPNGNFPCDLQWGVDNNRNYGNLWGGPGSSQDPTSQSFHGPGPRSEPETQAVWNYARTHQVTGLISLHTIAALVLRPPGLHDAGLSPDEQAMKKLGDAMATATGYTSQYSFQLYDTAGTTEDDTYAATGGYGYTIEIGPAGGVFHGPYDEYVIGQWNKGDKKGTTGMREALLLMGESVADPAQHAVITGTAPAGAKLKLTRKGETVTSPYCDLGVDPVLNVGALPDQVACPGGMKAPQKLQDTIETTTVVPAGGAFTWHVNQSTRPFVGGGAIIRTLNEKPTREQTFTGEPAGPDRVPGNSSEDREFKIAPTEHPESVKVHVEWPTPEDYDLEVYRKNPDGTIPDTPIASSGNNPGTPEEVVLSGDQVTPGATYVVRVVNFVAVSGTWTATVGLYDVTETVTTGHREAYTMTCEIGGRVVQSTQVTIDRGQELSLEPCSSAAPAAANAVDDAPPPAADQPKSAGVATTGAATTTGAARPSAGGPAPAATTPASTGAVTTGSGTTAAVPVTHSARRAHRVTRAQVRRATRSCARARHAAARKHGAAKGLASYRAKRTCARAATLRKRYAILHKKS